LVLVKGPRMNGVEVTVEVQLPDFIGAPGWVIGSVVVVMVRVCEQYVGRLCWGRAQLRRLALP
jgi:hypothetical protein